MSDLITLARTYLKTHLDNNALSLSEASAVQAMVGFLQENVQPGSTLVVEETPEFVKLAEENITNKNMLKAVAEELTNRIGQHELDIKQRDYNWSELQKAKTQIESLQAELEKHEDLGHADPNLNA